MDRALLYRRDRKTWIFEPSKKYGELVHTTKRGTVYAIVSGHKTGKPFWVARLLRDGRSWFTVERELRAKCIVFEGAGKYEFNDT